MKYIIGTFKIKCAVIDFSNVCTFQHFKEI